MIFSMIPTLISALYVFFLCCAIGSIVYWGAVWIQIWRTRRLLPTARDGIAISELTPPTQSACVIVPCHNEAGNIAILIQSLKEQDYDRLRVVLALDRCTDNTAGVARDAIGDDSRFEIVEISSCPDDWAGKVHAAHSGYEKSVHGTKADVLIFTDADTWLDTACVRACMGLLVHRELDFLSLLSTLNAKRWYERIVQPMTAFELARQYPLLRVNRQGKGKRAFANGQFMMFNAQAYQAIEGHIGVRDAILEDIAFARKIEYSGHNGGLLFADDMLRCRMYDTWEEYVRGWKRIYTESANREVSRLNRYALRTPIVCAVLPLGSLILIGLCMIETDLVSQWFRMVSCVLGVLGVGMWFAGVGAMYRLSRAPLRDIPGAMVGAFLTGWIFRSAARDLTTGTPTLWGGRSYVRQAEN
jgi:glycosyltransferase involved in cell wall biosynthesis